MIAFFDMFDYALTDFEVWRMLSIERELIEVIKTLDDGIGGVERYNGFYFLAGRGAIANERLARYNFTGRKFKRAILISKIFRFIPWIKMIAVGNLLGAHNLRDNSDIDFFIIAEDKRIWLTRFFCVSMVKLLGLRPKADNSRDKICLSFYVSDKAMDLKGLMLKKYQKEKNENGFRLVGRNDGEEDDIYFIYWLAGLTPIFDSNGVYEKFISANSWLKSYLPNWRPVNPAKRRRIKPLLGEFYHDVIELLAGGLEPQFRRAQIKILPPQLKNLMNQDSRVVINDQIIKLHANDRREEYRERYLDKINKL